MTEENEDSKDSFAALHKELCLGRFKGPVQHLACAALCSAFKLGIGGGVLSILHLFYSSSKNSIWFCFHFLFKIILQY